MTARAHPAIALSVYAEELASGARVAIFGSAALGLAEELAERGARLVHVYDEDPARVAEATAKRHDRTIFYAPLPESGDIGVRDGAFDLVIVPDLSSTEDAGALLALVRRVLSPAGAALVASPNTEAARPLIPVSKPRAALGYYELYEAVAEHFSSVRMIGQAPFVGYAVAEFSVEDPEPTIDSSLAEVEGKEPDWFWALASDKNVRLEPFALIELPPDMVGSAEEEEEAPHRPLTATVVPGELPSGEGTVLADILEAEREAALESLRQQEQTVKEERFRAEHTARELAAAREELALLRERCETLKKSLEEEESRRAALELQVEHVRESPEVALLREKVRTLETAAKAEGGEHEKDVAQLEAQLKERGHEISELKGEVSRREELVRELIATKVLPAVEAASSGEPGDGPTPEDQNGAVADLTARLDRLASEAARREADLVASRWKIAQLERELAQQR